MRLILVVFRLTLVLILSLILSSCVALANSGNSISPPKQTTQPNEAPRRLTINVSVTDPDDLKVAEGDRISVGQLIADRGRERQRLEAQARQLDLTLQRLEHSHYPTGTTGYAATDCNAHVSRRNRRHRPC